jgi:hypothetical protein
MTRRPILDMHSASAPLSLPQTSVGFPVGPTEQCDKSVREMRRRQRIDAYRCKYLLGAAAVHQNATEQTAPFADDLLQGARAIAVFLFGDPREARAVYYRYEKKRLPCFRLGGATIYARKSVLIRYVEAQEQHNVGGRSV